MKKSYSFMYQMIVIGCVMFISKIIEATLPFTMPSSVIGLVLLFTLLCTNVIKLEQIENVGTALVDNIGLFFVPAGVSAIKSLDILKENPVGDLLAILLSTLILLACTGLFTQLILKFAPGKSEEKVNDKKDIVLNNETSIEGVN